ncbi:aspartate aminotransferase family protein [Senegalia massiliensis]|uniref:aspartate aminotransferase family protein n=1 Tax=Senegalia massiliensis TaxID=1720316 RepID=UPI0013EF437B|nr:acetylornithine/succinylornithine family transaminase [Senegalia massiliensis]
MENIFREDKKYILNVYNRINLEIVKSKGSYLYDEDGNKYLDMFSGLSVNNIGNSNEEIIQAILKQSSDYIHISNYFVSKSIVKLAKLLVENTHASKVFFTNSGTESNEAAIKIARKFGLSINKGKTHILAAYNSFHGRTLGSLSLTGQKKYQENFKPLLPDIDYFIYNNIEDLKQKVNHKTCAVFIELIQGEGGIIQIDNSFVKCLNELSKKYNFLIIVDEIQTGLGRTGELLTSHYYNIKPHITTLAKSLGGGLPLGAVLVSKDIENLLKKGEHGSTFGGNPVSCACGEVVINKILEKDFKKDLRRKSNYLLDKLYILKDKYPHIIKDIRGKGLMIGIDVGEYAFIIKEKALEKKLIINITNKTVIRLLPPLNIDTKEIDEFLDIFEVIISERI